MPKRPPLPCGPYFCPAPLRLLWPDDGIRARDIAALYGCSLSELERRAHRLDVWEQRRHRRTMVYSMSEFRRLWADQSVSTDEIGRRLGMVKRVVQAHARKLGLPRRTTGRKPVYPFDDLFEVMWREGVIAREIATVYGCAASLVGKEAERRGLPRRQRKAGWLVNSKTLAEFRQWQLRQALAASAASEQAALRRAEMVDRIIGTVARRAA